MANILRANKKASLGSNPSEAFFDNYSSEDAEKRLTSSCRRSDTSRLLSESSWIVVIEARIPVVLSVASETPVVQSLITREI